MHSLPLFHRIAGERVVVVGEGDMAVAKRRLVERAGGVCCSAAEAHAARIGFVALDDRREAEKAALRLRRAGLLVNVADRPELCDFTLPSVLDRDPVLIAVSTGGASAGLAKHLRLRLEAILPRSLGYLASSLHAARDVLRRHYPEADQRRRAIDALLSEGGALDPLSEASADRAAALIVDEFPGHLAPRSQAEVVEVALAGEDPDDLTLRQARWLGQADTILHDSAVSPEILARGRADAVRRALPADPPSAGFTVIVRAEPTDG